MADLLSSTGFESLPLGAQVTLAFLAILVTGLGTYGTVRAVWSSSRATLRGGRALWTSLHDAPEVPKAQPSVSPGDLCRTLLHLLEQFAPWSTAVAGDKTPVRFLTHTNGRVRIEFKGNDVDKIEYFLAGTSINDDLTTAEIALLDAAALKRKDAVLASLAACGEGQGHGPHMTREEYQATLRGGTVLPPAPVVKR